MAGLLEDFTRTAIEQEIKTNYPHIEHPAGIYARVVFATEDNGKYICVIRILDRSMNIDKSFPEIPGVKTDIKVKAGDTVAVLMLYGGSAFYILGRYDG